MSENKKISKAGLRLQAFWQERKAAGEAPAGKGAKRSRKKTSQTTELGNLAALRLAALQQYRELQLTSTRRAQLKRDEREPFAPPPANNWVPIGPGAVLRAQGVVQPTTNGRIAGIAIAPGGRRLYAATANGGVWRSEDEGKSWKSLMDGWDENAVDTSGVLRQADSLACGAIALIPGDSALTDTVIVGTGEGHELISPAAAIGHDGGQGMYGTGVLISSDGGLNWAHETTVDTGGAAVDLVGEGFFEIAVDPGNPQRMVAATTNGIFVRIRNAAGVVRWERRQLAAVALNAIVTSVVAARSNGVTRFFAARNSDPNIYESADGLVWTALPVVGGVTPVPAGGGALGRVSLAVKRDETNVLYAFASTGDVFRWDPVGGWRSLPFFNPPPANLHNLHAFNGIPTPGDSVGVQGWYDLVIAVAPDNVNQIYLGGATIGAHLNGSINTNVSNSGDEFSASIFRCDLTPPFVGNYVRTTYIGSTVHADIHAFAFSKGGDNSDISSKLWVGCDGGMFFTNNAKGQGRVFESRNNGLQTLTMNFLGLTDEDAILFCGTQDNGGLRYLGQLAWEYVTPGDSGCFVIDWNNRANVLSTFTNDFIQTSTQGGRRGSFNFPPGIGIPALFYAPVIAPPRNLAFPADARVIAFGSNRPWISNNFGQTGALIPLAAAFVNGLIRSMIFTYVGGNLVLYAGTEFGSIFRFVRVGAAWTLQNMAVPPVAAPIHNPNGPAPSWANGIPVTSITVDPANNNNIYVTLGNFGAHDHVWHFDGVTATWTGRSAGLLPIQHNSIVIDPADNQTLYVAADIGIWKSTDAGLSWNAYSEGLPDAAVIDLKIRPASTVGAINRPAILYASTHGRGVFERIPRTDETTGSRAIELYIRRTELDLGRHDIIPGGTNVGGVAVSPDRSPDIKVNPPDNFGNYQFYLDPGEQLDFVQFTDQLTDRPDQVAAHATAVVTSKVYVQIHNRGVTPSNEVRVVLLLASANGAIPPLPIGYEAHIRDGTAVETGGWQTVGQVILRDLRVGFPQIATFDLTSDLLPQPGSLGGGNDQHCLLALAHHAGDAYPSSGADAAAATDTRAHILVERKAALKTIRVVPFTGTVPEPVRSLDGFVSVPASATRANAPYDAFLAAAFAQNDLFFHNALEHAYAAPLASRGGIAPAALRAHEFLQVDEINITALVTLLPKVPLIWTARRRITISARIDGAGKGAAFNEPGDFGGSGGGGNTTGQACVVPVSRAPILGGGAVNAAGNDFNPDWASRIWMHLGGCRGGAGGGGVSGGAGGGIVVLCAPEIVFAAGAEIDVRGGAATNGGGGGGGTVVLLAGRIIGAQTGGNIHVAGGAGAGGGGNGGNGVYLPLEFNR